MHRLLRALRCAHLYHNFIGFNMRVPHGVLTMHHTSSAGSMLEEDVIKGGPHNIVGKGWLKGVDLECKSVGTTSLILIIERCSRLDQETGTAQGIVTTQTLEDRHVGG